MVVPAALRPTRRLVFPFSVVLFPIIWFVYRDAGVRVVDGQRVLTPLSRTLTLAVAAVAASYLLAAVAVSALDRGDEPATRWRRLLLRPTDGTLVTVALLWSAVVAYVALESAATLPFWSELVVGVPLLWPLLVAILLSFAAGNAVPALQAFPVRAGFVAVGLALSAAWIFLLSSGIARAVSPAE